MHPTQEKLIAELHAELKEKAKSLKEKADLVSKLYEEREVRKKYAQVMPDFSKFKRQATDAPPPVNAAAQPLDPDDDRMKRKCDVLSKR